MSITEHKVKYFYLPFLNSNPVEHHAKCNFAKKLGEKTVSVKKKDLHMMFFILYLPYPFQSLSIIQPQKILKLLHDCP